MAAKLFWRTRAMGTEAPRLIDLKAKRAGSSSQLPCWQSTRTQSKPACDNNSTARCDPKTAPTPIADFPCNIRSFAVLIRILALSTGRAAGVHCQVAAIHGDDGAGDPGRSIGGQEDSQTFNVFRLAKAAHGDAAQEGA